MPNLGGGGVEGAAWANASRRVWRACSCVRSAATSTEAPAEAATPIWAVAAVGLVVVAMDADPCWDADPMSDPCWGVDPVSLVDVDPIAHECPVE